MTKEQVLADYWSDSLSHTRMVSLELFRRELERLTAYELIPV